MNITIKDTVHASTNPYRTVCGLSISKRHKPTGSKITCLVCEAKEAKRFKNIQAYIQKLLEDDVLPLDQRMWKLVGYVEQGVRQ